MFILFITNFTIFITALIILFIANNKTNKDTKEQERVIIVNTDIAIPNITFKTEPEYPHWVKINFDSINSDKVTDIINDWKSYVEMYAWEYGVDEYLVYAIIYAESVGSPTAKSHRGAMGLMQLMPSTARSVGVYDCYNPEQNIKGGCRYIAEIYDNVEYDEIELLHAWNAGMYWVNRGIFPQETRGFICKVLSVKIYLEMNAI